MSFRSKKRMVFHFLGACLVGCWLVMMGLLVQRVHFKDSANRPAEVTKTSPHRIDSSQREWREIFLKDKKVGYAVNLIKPFQGGYFIQEEIFLRMNLLGQGSNLHSVTQCRVDESFVLQSFTFSMSSGVVHFQLSGKVDGEVLLLEAGRAKDRKTQRVKLAKAPMMSAGMSHFFRSRKLSVGETFRFPLFDPSTLAQKEMVVRVVAQEPLAIHRVSYKAYRLETEMWGKSFSMWVDEEGSFLKEQGFMGLTAVRSNAARAPEDLDGKGGADLYELTAIRPDRRIPDPNRLNSLKVEITGLEGARIEKDILNGLRQHYEQGTMEIRKETIPSSAGYKIPWAGAEDPKEEFLRPELNIESQAEEIQSKVREIIGTERDPVSVTRKLVEWVYLHIEKRPVLSVPSALEVLRSGAGDCNEHAVLLTAYLRAAGIPSRLAIGVVYSRDRFFYHAWNEAYLGAWVSMDATLNQVPADPSHIKLIEGNLERQVELAGLVGEMKIKVLDFRYD